MAAGLTERDRLFLEIDLERDSGNPVAVSPECDDATSGLVLAAPERIPLAEQCLPVCGAASFSSSDRNALPHQLWDRVVVCVTDLTRNRVVAESLADPSPIPGDELAPEDDGLTIDPSLPDEPSSGADVPLQGGGMIQYRNFDAVAVLGMNLEPGPYAVFLTYGKYKSNTVIVTVLEPA